MIIALSLTLLRVVLGPVFLGVYFYYEELGFSLLSLPYILLALLLVAELSDVFDGVIARTCNVVTDLGRVLDPMADSIFRLTVFFAFTQGIVQLPLGLVLAFFYRDSMIGTLRTVCALKGMALAARLSGKIKAVAQAVACFIVVALLFLFTRGVISLDLLQQLSFGVVGLVCAYTIGSGVEYVIASRRHILQAIDR